MNRSKPEGKDKFQRTVQVSDNFTKPVFNDNRKKRENQRSVKEDNLKDFSIGIKDIDETIHYYFSNVITPNVIQNGKRLNVPIMYGSPERWKAVQKDGFYRDKNGKIQTPLIMFRRESIERNRNMSRKMDGNNPSNYIIAEKKYTKKNIYDRLSVLGNRQPVKEYETIIVPDFVDLTYSCIIFSDYVEQMNKIIEAINYAAGAYWGDPNRFQFRAMIDSYTTTTEVSQGQDRVVKTSFSIKLMGRIIPDTINATLQGSKKVFSKSIISFGLETTTSDLETVNTNNPKPIKQSAGTRVVDTVFERITNQALSQDQITYLSTNVVLSSNTTDVDVDGTLNRINWNAVSILTPPSGFPSLTVSDFKVYINGMIVEVDAIDSIYQQGSKVVVQFNTSLGFEITDTDEFNISGKLVK